MTEGGCEKNRRFTEIVVGSGLGEEGGFSCRPIPIGLWNASIGGGIIVFVGLAAYDAQKIRAMALQAFDDEESERKGAVIGALQLYLDFINLFLLLLRIFGRRR